MYYEGSFLSFDAEGANMGDFNPILRGYGNNGGSTGFLYWTKTEFSSKGSKVEYLCSIVCNPYNSNFYRFDVEYTPKTSNFRMKTVRCIRRTQGDNINKKPDKNVIAIGSKYLNKLNLPPEGLYFGEFDETTKFQSFVALKYVDSKLFFLLGDKKNHDWHENRSLEPMEITEQINNTTFKLCSYKDGSDLGIFSYYPQ